MSKLIYSFLLLCALPFFLPSLYRKKLGKPSVGKRWKEHFGFTPKLNAKSEEIIWIHAVSVGETIAATPLIKQLKKAKPDSVILLTTTTATGAAQAEKLGDIIIHRYMPLDFCFAIKRFVKTVRPSKLIIIETELWPNTLTTLKKLNIPVSLVNARLSDKSYQGYKRFLFLTKNFFPCIEQVICQHKSDADNFHKLGIDTKKLFVSGSIKFDLTIDDMTEHRSEQLRNQLGRTRPTWIAASTHSGEDELVLQAHHDLLTQFPTALLILVPRHPERFNEVFELCDKTFDTVRRTSKERIKESNQIYLGDTMGEMLELIGSADICFMGGSLLGNKVGGHNMLEPAALSKPILTGPSYFNFKDITNQLVDANACQVVSTSQELSNSLVALFNNEGMREKQGLAARNVVDSNQGAIDRTLHYLGVK